jgi:NADPH:quinone reductase-like Zn-dependent oxidoreductase
LNNPDLSFFPIRNCRANEVIIAGRDDVQEAILKFTDGLGAEVIYDAVGGPGLEELIWAAKRFGHVIAYGQLGANCRPEPKQLSVQRNSFLTAWLQDFFRQWSIESFSDWTNTLLPIVTWR